MIAFFVTGTDTSVGKTTVSRALLAAATARGLRTRCCKPVETGCGRAADGSLVAHDAGVLWEATDRVQPPGTACVYSFEEPAAPGVAAERAGQRIDIAALVRHIRSLCEPAPDVLLVEGAGGLLVPLGSGKTIADLAVAVSFPLLIVARPGLGTINHTRLTIEAARARGLEVRGVVFSAAEGPADAVAMDSNANEIRRASGVPVLGDIPHLPGAPTEQLAGVIESQSGLSALLPSVYSSE